MGRRTARTPLGQRFGHDPPRLPPLSRCGVTRLCIASHWFGHDIARPVSVSGLDPSTASQRLERDAVLLHLLSDWVVTSAGHRPASDWITAQAIEFGSTISVSFRPPDTDLRLERDAGHLPPLSNWSPHGPEICPQAVGSPHNPSNPDQRLAFHFAALQESALAMPRPVYLYPETGSPHGPDTSRPAVRSAHDAIQP